MTAQEKNVQVEDDEPHLDVHIVLDTNAIVSGSPAELFSLPAKSILSSELPTDVRATWYMPDMVRLERIAQMAKIAISYEPNFRKLSKLMGIDSLVSEDSIYSRIESLAEGQMNKLGIKTISLDYSRVDWGHLMVKSARRKPPFSPDERSEKGFKDAIILESCMQLIDGLELWEDRHFVLVTNDELLGGEFDRINEGSLFIRRFQGIAEVGGYFQQESLEIPDNLLAIYESLTPSLLESLRVQVDNMLNQKFGAKLLTVPSEGLRRVNDPWKSTSLPLLDGRQDDRLRWNSLVTLDFSAFGILDFSAAGRSTATDDAEFAALTFLHRNYALNVTPRPVDRGYAMYRVYWSTRIVEPNDLVDPILEDIQAIGHRWWSEPSERE